MTRSTTSPDGVDVLTSGDEVVGLCFRPGLELSDEERWGLKQTLSELGLPDYDPDSE